MSAQKADLRSFDFVIDRLFMKLFSHGYCQRMSAIF